jgi:rubrerythrin
MKEQIPVGGNRTGVQMSPMDTKEMLVAPPASAVPFTPGDESSIEELRASYIQEADPIGSVPVPGTVKGALTTGFSMLTGNQPQLLLDKLGERLAFERTGTRLYDALIAKVDALGEDEAGVELDELRQIRDEEARHFAIVVNAIESVGGDPTSQTPCADLVGVESMGLMQVVTDPRTTVAQSLHAILVAEMTDNAGWESLIALAQDQGQDTMITEFSLALDDERRHLIQVQRWYELATLGRSISDEARDLDEPPGKSLH